MASQIVAPSGEKLALTPRARVRRIIERVLPWTAFAAFMVWAWGPLDVFHAISNYGDAFENIVTSTWFSDALASGQNPLIYPYNYFPEGWHIGSHSIGSLLYLMLAPLVWVGGGAFTYNLVVFLNCVLGFAGALLLARRHLRVLPATLVALAIAFWSLRWSQAQDGRLNILLASTALPWMLWGVEKALAAATRGRRLAWLVFAGACWAFTLNMTLYFVFIGGILLAAWMLPAKGSRVEPWSRRLLALAFVVLVLLILGAPWVAFNLHESAAVETPFYGIVEVNFSGASLNSLPVWFLNHPWLGDLARTLYQGEPWEQGMANLGVTWTVMALLGIFLARRRRAWLPALGLAAVGLLFSLGLTLHWNGQPVQWQLLRPLNTAIWHIGHALKPGFFTTAEPPPPFADAIPLPGLLLSTFVPFLERGRMFVRYSLAANIGVLMLAGMALVEVGKRWPQRPRAARAVQWALAILLLIEIVPPRLATLPYPPPGHPAYTWLSQQALGDQGIASVFAAHPSAIVLSNFGYNLLAVDYHRQATVSGAAGVRPKQNTVLNEWLATHEHPFWNPDFAQIMRAYKVRYLLLEMKSDWEKGLWEELQAAKELKPVNCFPAPEGESPWNWPICIAEVLPEQFPKFNVLLHEGWSGMEEWGVWAEGVESHAQFVLTRRSDVRLEVGAFPLCVPGRPQQIWIDVNGVEAANYLWPDCEPWKTEVVVPADQVRVGFNDVTVRAAFAQRAVDAPVDDPRQLSVGLTRLRATAEP